MDTSSKHPEKALSAVKVRSIAEPGRYADGGGLYLLVEPSGAKRWVLRTVICGKRCDIGLGGTALVSLAEARQKALEMRKIARGGGDPLAERRRARTRAPTFEEAARTVHAEHCASWKNPKHRAQWINTLSEYVFPAFGTKPVSAVESSDLLRALSPIWLTKPETARRVRQRIGTVLDWAKTAGYRHSDNPAQSVSKGLPKQPKQDDHHAALDYKDVPAFIQQLRESDASDITKLAFEFLILTATRTNEVLLARWDEIDFEAKCWTIPEPRMKAHKEHRVPLAPRCIELLMQARTLSNGSGYVFPGAIPERPLSNMVFLMALRRMGVSVTAHGFRSVFRDWAAERTNFPREICEKALAHTLKNKTEAAYQRGDLLDKRRTLMDTWASYIRKNKAEVIQLRADKS